MGGPEPTATRTLERMLEEQPRFHGREEAGTTSLPLRPKVLKWILHNVAPGTATLETGCGYSTVALALAAADHTVISPFEQEHALIRQWCGEHGISTDHVTFMASPSQEVVPRLEKANLSFVLIDGDHAFPAPFIDWYYTADRIANGGFVAIDDTQLPTGTIMCQFLSKEASRWRLAERFWHTTIFQRTTDGPVAEGVMWTEQPFCREPRRALLKRFARKLWRTHAR